MHSPKRKTQAKKDRKKNTKITKKINLNRLVSKYPKLARILIEDYGLHCVGCAVAFFETLEDGAKAHGMSDKEIDKMVERLNNQMSQIIKLQINKKIKK